MLYKCPSCNGAGFDEHPQYAFGDVFQIVCQSCNGLGAVDQEMLRAIEVFNPELFWKEATHNEPAR